MFGSTRRRIGTFLAGCAFTAVAAFALAVSAQASPVALGHCDNSALSQAFLHWGDSAYYKLAPGADFEGSLAGWSLSGGARRVSGSESYGVTGSVGSWSLGLPAGAAAMSPQTCVNAAYPDFRLFTRTDAPGSKVTVSVQYNSPQSGPTTIPVGVITPTSAWQPTAPMLTGSAIPGLMNGGTAEISLRFAAANGTVQVDDVYVDPWGKG